VAQEPDLGTGSVRKVLEHPLDYKTNMELKKNLKKVPELFDHFSLSRGLLDKEVTSLSGGEKQRLALIGAILLDRKIYLLDEATSALDQANREIVLKYFREHENLTVLSITHSNDAVDVNQRVIEICRHVKGDS
jgi:ABC-type iron transport system FetAB ATPase subunit